MGYGQNYNWHCRATSIFDKDPLNQQTLGRIFSFLHHMGSHAPAAVKARWRKAEWHFMEHHMPNNASMRFANKFTAHRWL